MPDFKSRIWNLQFQHAILTMVMYFRAPPTPFFSAYYVVAALGARSDRDSFTAESGVERLFVGMEGLSDSFSWAVSMSIFAVDHRLQQNCVFHPCSR